MKRGNIANQYERLFDLAQTIGTQICSNLNLKLVYKAKLEQVCVSIHEGKSTNCMFVTKNEEDLRAFFVFNEEDSKDEIWTAFCIGHEFSHMLFTRFDVLGDFCETDGSYAYTNVQRFANGKQYGLALEEFLCDYIAIDVVSKITQLDKSVVTEYLIKHTNGRVNSRNLDITEKILSMFSRASLEENDCYDAVIVDEGGVTQKNLLLYEAAQGYDMSSLITDYDKAMGEGSWMRLNQNLDKYYLEESELDFSKVQAELNLFSLRYQ